MLHPVGNSPETTEAKVVMVPKTCSDGCVEEVGGSSGLVITNVGTPQLQRIESNRSPSEALVTVASSDTVGPETLGVETSRDSGGEHPCSLNRSRVGIRLNRGGGLVARRHLMVRRLSRVRRSGSCDISPSIRESWVG